jgi:hypothetical protein
LQIEDLSRFGALKHLALEQRDFAPDDRFDFSDSLLGKIRRKGASAHAMPVVGYGAKQAILGVRQRLSSRCMAVFCLSHCLGVSYESISSKDTTVIPGNPPNLLGNGVQELDQKNNSDFSLRLLPDGYISE